MQQRRPPDSRKMLYQAHRIPWRKVGLFIVSLLLFILALMVMKEGAKALSPLLQDRLDVAHPTNALGFGWIFAYIIMSGSPVAASALTFHDAGLLTETATYTMITGSRLGSSFIVIFIGIIYVIRGRDRATNLSMGLLSLTVTASLHAVSLGLGLWLLASGVLADVRPGRGALLTALTDYLFDPVVNLLASRLPHGALFAIGLGAILLSFNLFDKCLPEMALKESKLGWMGRLVYRPVIMFALGGAITLISMSVSVSLSILVPLNQRGFVRRENVIPYIMGANVTTFIDTLFAALLLTQPTAFTVVLAQMISVSIVSLLCMTLILRPYERVVLAVVAWVTADDRNLMATFLVILALPLALLIV